MLFFVLILLLVIIIAILLFTIALKMEFILDTNKDIMQLTMLWLYPFIKAEISMQTNKPTLEVFLFNIKVYKKAIKAKKSGKFSSHGIHLIQDIRLNDFYLTAKYGFQDKFIVGAVCGLINFITTLLKVDLIEQTPDFTADNDYIYIRATADINIMPTLKSLASH